MKLFRYYLHPPGLKKRVCPKRYGQYPCNPFPTPCPRPRAGENLFMRFFAPKVCKKNTFLNTPAPSKGAGRGGGVLFGQAPRE